MLNNSIIQGRLTRDVEKKTAENGTLIGNFALACERSIKGANGERQTDFIPCTAFGKTAETISKYFHKGDMIIIGGRLNVSQYEKNGEKRTYFNITVNEFNFCYTAKSESAAPTTPTTGGTTAPDMNATTAPELKIDVDNLPFDF